MATSWFSTAATSLPPDAVPVIPTRPSAIVLLALLLLPLLAACGDVAARAPSVFPSHPALTPAAGAPAGDYLLRPLFGSPFLERPLGLAFIPSTGAAVVAGQGGRLWKIWLDNSQPAALFGDISTRLIRPDPHNEEGLLGIVLSPQFNTDAAVYLHYTAGDPRRGVISRFRVRDEVLDPDSEEVILEVAQPYANHNGGQLAFGPDGYLYIALGDGGSFGDPKGRAQDLTQLLGSILRLDVSGPGSGYRIPADNPFSGRPAARSEIYAYGLRNPWRFSFDRLTGEIWAGDVGQRSWEEVDRIVAGGNYGWNVMEGFACYAESECEPGRFRLPWTAYGHGEGCAVIGGYVYRGRALPALQGRYIYGDYCSGTLWSVATDERELPQPLLQTGLQISSFAETPEGELLVLAFSGYVYRLETTR